MWMIGSSGEGLKLGINQLLSMLMWFFMLPTFMMPSIIEAYLSVINSLLVV